MPTMATIGTRVGRVEDERLITGRGTFVDNLRGPGFGGAAYLTFVRSPVAHARLVGVDLTAARLAPGVIAALAAPDLDLPAREPPFVADLHSAIAQPYLATDTVRFAGEPVAMVVTERRDQGADAADLVLVEYERLPPVVSPEPALNPGVLLFPESGTNVVYTAGALTDDSFADCEVVVSQRLVNQRLAAVPMEPRAYTCLPTPDQRLVLWASTQTPHLLRDEILERLGLAPGSLRVVAPDVGGGFGAKSPFDAEAVMVCWLARHLGRGIRWSETRTESMMTLGHGRAQWQQITIAGRRDGTLLAYRLEIVADAGAYPKLGAVLPEGTVALASGVYAIPRVEAHSRSVLTNTNPTGAYRGAGRPEAIAAVERAVDLFAAEIGMDPARVRELNLLQPHVFPHVTPTGCAIDTGDYPAALRTVLAAADYPALRAEQVRRRAAGVIHQYGIGLSAYLDMTGYGVEDARLVLRRDGTVHGYAGTSPHGQGHATAFAMIIADALGVPLEQITVGFGDTDELPRGGGTFGSRSLQSGGPALQEAANQLRERARPLAASSLAAAEDEVDLATSTGQWFVRHDPDRRLSWAELAGRGVGPAGLGVEVEYKPTAETCPFGVHLALVEVDTETGKVTLLRLIAVDDAGNVVNPMLAEGQRHGGIAQGIGQALFEEFVYDEAGNPLTVSLADYTVPSAADLPNFELLPMQTPTPVNALGVKGIGESGTIGATPAVQNAVIDAVVHLGVRHIDMPLTPERVWSAINAALRPDEAASRRAEAADEFH
jgi:carbon-monoxide dehydrogenase large subunit